MNQGKLFIVCAPSGAGKTSLVRALLEKDTQVMLSISYTTRAMRPGEADGRDYHFVSREQFIAMLERSEFVESAEVYGNLYGTSQIWLNEAMQQGSDIILEIDWQGAAAVRKIFPDAVGLFILPPSLDALKTRLRGRGQDSDEVIERRLAAAREDISHLNEFDYVIINNEFDIALADLQAIFRAERLRLARQTARHRNLISELI
ncbi:MAG: guanylate kinase [Sulfuricellaceae bacterium]|nr:guanylate kinase [Sulfuricellaceae bacterium]